MCHSIASVVAQGERFHEFKKDNFYQIQWRPRPASLLTSAEKKKVVKNLRKVRQHPSDAYTQRLIRSPLRVLRFSQWSRLRLT